MSVITIDDQDYDGEWEIIIGHTHGFDMWEHVPGSDSQYVKVEHVTASPNYPLVKLRSMVYSFESIGPGGRMLKDAARLKGTYSNTGWVLYETNGTPGTAIEIKAYRFDTHMWIPGVPLSSVANYSAHGITVNNEQHPSVTVFDNGDIYIGWEATSNTSTHYLCLLRYDYNAGTWSDVWMLSDPFWGTRQYPQVIEYNATHLAVVYLYTLWGTSRVNAFLLRRDLTGPYTWVALHFEGYNQLDVHDISAVRMPDGRVAIAMSASSLLISKPDNDIWVVVGPGDLNFTGVQPHQASTEFSEDMYVSIDYLRDREQTLVVTYERVDMPLEERIAMVASANGGATWGVPEAMNTLPSYVYRQEHVNGYVYYKDTRTDTPVYGPQAYGPAIMPLDSGGFMYVISFTYIEPHMISDLHWVMINHMDLVYGFNDQSDWSDNSLRNVVDLAVGDTDCDGRREVVVAFEDRVGVYEMKGSNNGTGFMSYEEAWLSEPFEEEATGVTVYDTNGNGWPEIGISTGRGNVYFMEYRDPSEGAMSLRYSQQDWELDVGPVIGPGPRNRFLAAYDYDSDSRDEVVIAEPNGRSLRLVDDDGTELWSVTASSSRITDMVLCDLDNDTVPEIVVTSYDVTVHTYEGATGDLLWTFTNTSSSGFGGIATGDLTGDGLPEVVVSMYAGGAVVLSGSGQFLSYLHIPGLGIIKLLVGNFSPQASPGIATASLDGRVCLTSANGTVLYTSPIGTASIYSPLASYDFSGDGYDELVFGKDALHVYDFVNGSFYHNSTTLGETIDLHLADFDDDGDIEVLVMTKFDGVYMYQVSTGTAQWVYRPANASLYIHDVGVGHFGGVGALDVIITVGETDRNGVLLAVDGQSGMPMWFNRTGGVILHTVAADLTGDGTDSIVGWDFEDTRLVATSAVGPTEYGPPEAFPMHDRLWTQRASDVSMVYAKQLTGHYTEEVVFVFGKTHLRVMDGGTGDPVWGVDLDSVVIEVEFMTTSASGPDVALLLGDGSVRVYDGDTGTLVFSVPEVSGYSTVAIETGDFNHPSLFDELAILYHRPTSPYTTYVEWYTAQGSSLYSTTSFTTSSWSLKMDSGVYAADGTRCVVVAGSSLQSRFYAGNNGTYLGSMGTGSVYRLTSGHFTSTGYECVAVMNSAYDITVLDFELGVTSPVFYFDTGHVRQFMAADVAANDGIDELVVNLAEVGVVGYKFDGSLAWSYYAPLVSTSARSVSVAFADMDGDGWDDMVMSNNEYVDVVNGATRRLMWHYRNPGKKTNYYPVPILAHSHSVRDVLTYSSTDIYVISASPPAASPGPASGLSVEETVMMVTAAGVPLVFLFLVVPLVRRRRRVPVK